jgi:hypothetical protein
MSAVEAVKPLRRRALERQGMTREQELELLVQEQQADDIYAISRPAREISFDAPSSTRSWLSVGNFIAEVDGQVVSFLPRRQESLFFVSFKHASFDAYNNHGCRCRPCKNFMAEYRRAKRAA